MVLLFIPRCLKCSVATVVLLFIPCVTKVFWMLLQWYYSLFRVFWSVLLLQWYYCLFRVLLKCSECCYSGTVPLRVGYSLFRVFWSVLLIQWYYCLFRVLLKCSECCYSGTIVYSVCSEVFCCYSGTTVHSVCYWSVLNVVTVVNNTVFVWWDSCLFTVLLKCSERVYSGEQHCRLSHGTTVYSLCY